jgi:tetratricopeptide (TPR) repeat protein
VFYVNEGRNAEAEPLANKAMEIRRRVLGPEHPETVRSVNNLGLLYLKLRRYDQAESLLRTALSGFEKDVPDGWERYNCQSMLGASIAGQKRFEEGEPLVISAYQELVQRAAAIPPANASVVDQAGQRVIQLYRDWGRPEKVLEWAKRVGRQGAKP